MHALLQQIGQRVIDRTLAGDAVHSRKGWRFDLNREMAFASVGIVAAMPAMFLAVVNDLEVRCTECLGETSRDFGGDRAG